VSFGLVNVPVKLFTAVRHKDVRFHQLHVTDGARVQQRRVCSLDGEELAFEDIARGYEISPGRYVVVEQEDLDTLDPESTRRIDVEAFVPLGEIDPLFYDGSYYVAPDASGSRAYKLLVDAMVESGQVGIGRFVLRTKEYLCAVRPVDGMLVLSTMNYADEIADPGELDGFPTAEAPGDERELEMARRLIELLSKDFDPTAYHDTYRERLLGLIERKAEGQEITVPQPAEVSATVVDLMAALEASVAAADKSQRAASS
jgi:DNA end-binding protein Ku